MGTYANVDVTGVEKKVLRNKKKGRENRVGRMLRIMEPVSVFSYSAKNPG